MLQSAVLLVLCQTQTQWP